MSAWVSFAGFRRRRCRRGAFRFIVRRRLFAMVLAPVPVFECVRARGSSQGLTSRLSVAAPAGAALKRFLLSVAVYWPRLARVIDEKKRH